MKTWAEILAEVVASIPHRPYVRGGTGVTQELWWRGKRILAPDKNGGSYCSGATFQALVLALRAAGLEPHVTAAEVHELRRWVYVLDEDKAEGVAGGLVALGWAESVEVSAARAGDAAQIQWRADEDPLSGHAVVVIDSVRPHPTKQSGGSVLWGWSSNTTTPRLRFAPSQESPFRPRAGALQAGTQADWYSLGKPGRRFCVARLLPAFLAQGGAVNR